MSESNTNRLEIDGSELCSDSLTQYGEMMRFYKCMNNFDKNYRENESESLQIKLITKCLKLPFYLPESVAKCHNLGRGM